MPKPSSNSVDCLNGLKVFSMLWVMLGHLYMWTLGLPLMNFLDIPDVSTLKTIIKKTTYKYTSSGNELHSRW